jgi:hypothetical protein
MAPAELAEWEGFRNKYLSSSDAASEDAADGYRLARSIVSLLRSVDGELTPERLADNYKLVPPDQLPRKRGIDLIRFNGKSWEVVESDVKTPPLRNAPLNH